MPRLVRLQSLLLAVVTLLAGCGGGGGGGELRPLGADVGGGVMVRALFAGDELVYAFVADPGRRVMTMKVPPATLPSGLVYCFGLEDGLFLDGEPVAPPAGASVFALLADGSTSPIELSPSELAELSRSLRKVKGPLEDEALAARLRTAVAEQ